MIKFDHVHEDGKDCFLIRTRYGTYTNIYTSRLIDHVTFTARRVIIAYLNYTSCWYVFDFHTGEDIATLRGKDNLIARNIVYCSENEIASDYRGRNICA